jgi:adenine-specific DNA-methyltransferase
VLLPRFSTNLGTHSTTGQTAELLASVADYLLWYAKNKDQVKYRQLHRGKELGDEGATKYTYLELADGTRRRIAPEELADLQQLPKGSRPFRIDNLVSQGFRQNTSVPYKFQGRIFDPGFNQNWKTTLEGLDRLAAANRIIVTGDTLGYVRYLDDFPAFPLTNLWTDTAGIQSRADPKIYAVQTATTVVSRCVLMSTDPGELVFDPTCGSGTTAHVAEQWGRRWITCDTSRVALTLARQRLLTATFPYYRLARPDQGVSGGFVYKTVPHVTLKSIAQEEPPQEETLYDQPEEDRTRVRVSGPFTIEAIPVPVAELPEPIAAAGKESPARETGPVVDLAGSYVDTMIELLKRSGVAFPGGKRMALGSLRPVASGSILHAEAEIQGSAKSLRVAVSFGPQHGPVTVLQVEEAVRQAAWTYDALVFAGFAFDPEAQAFIEKSPHPKLRTHFALISPDVLVGDLLKTSKAHQLFTVFGQPDISARPQKDGRWVVELRGVDIYDPTTGELSSSAGEEVAAWFLDQDYDGRTFFICQAFFPGGTNPWEKLQRALRGIVDETVFETMRGVTSHPFQAGEHKRIAVKVIDFRGNEVMRVMDLEDRGQRS